MGGDILITLLALHFVKVVVAQCGGMPGWGGSNWGGFCMFLVAFHKRGREFCFGGRLIAKL